jgi:S-adenosyl methyltransferase
MERPSWAPADVDLDRPSAARMYDFFLGGSHHFAVDREMAAQVLAAVPDFPLTARANRAFLHRAVRYLVQQGVRQFLDLGSGIPTVGNVHEIAQRLNPDVRVVYVDVDPVAVAHSRVLLAHDDRTHVIRADIRDPVAILADPAVRRLLDFRQPVAVLMASVLHFVPDSDRPDLIIGEFRGAMAPGSFLALSHGTTQARPDEGAEVLQLYRQTANPLTDRTREQLLALLTGFDLVEPGLVWAPQWRPEPDEDPVERPERTSVLAAVARLQEPGSR